MVWIFILVKLLWKKSKKRYCCIQLIVVNIYITVLFVQFPNVTTIEVKIVCTIRRKSIFPNFCYQTRHFQLFLTSLKTVTDFGPYLSEWIVARQIYDSLDSNDIEWIEWFT